ncbi:hypothetical protein CDAR_251801 [Caerostris darwini]|uniref:Uncharacterized protein n=1 Tax=Caerostris darwini TaxID=1538125 RepID=A0AAV4U2M9_9ARAC|nr:hypothetical protein CDAR_251801 [Caerostris darwini]
MRSIERKPVDRFATDSPVFIRSNKKKNPQKVAKVNRNRQCTHAPGVVHAKLPLSAVTSRHRYGCGRYGEMLFPRTSRLTIV